MLSYDPYKYPPDYQLGHLHQKASRPGKMPYLHKIKCRSQQLNPSYQDNNMQQCPCCRQLVMWPYSPKSWINRSINEDFKDQGGAIVTYFWLLRFYAFIFGIVFIVYSAYLLVCIYLYCDQDNCEKYLGLWVISNENLFQLMTDKNQHDAIIRLSLLRGIAYIILVVGNTVSLYLVSRFKKRYPRKKGITNFTLIFKNVHSRQKIQNEQDSGSIISINKSSNPADIVRACIQQKYPNSIVESFSISQFEPYYTLFNSKIRIYFQLLLLTPDQLKNNPKLLKTRLKLLSKLKNLHKQSLKYQSQFNITSDRVIVMLNSEIKCEQIYKKFQLKGIDKIKYFLGFSVKQGDQMYAQKCPLPEQINWNYIGHQQNQKIELKVISVLVFFGLVAVCFGVLSFCFKLIYVYQLPSPLGGILTFLSLFLIVVLAITFRQLMNKLSQMRYPNTQTSRTMFIVITTVLFHYIFYLAMPTFYFWQAQSHEKNKNLLIVTNQTLTFILAQVVLVGWNFVYYFWKKRQVVVQNQNKPIGCQKIIQQQIEYPRFPIQFKLIAIFKIFSFITFFAFQAPAVVFLTFFLLIYLYYSDKHAIYFHYKKQIIDSTVQFNFLKFYAWFFVVYSFIIFIITQNLQVEFWISFTVAAGCMVAIFFIKEPKLQQDQCDQVTNIAQLNLKDSYQRRYKQFVEQAFNQQLQQKIKQFIHDDQHLSHNIQVQNNQGSQQLI